MICSLVMLFFFFFLYKENQYLNPTFPQEKKSTSNYCNNRIIKKKKIKVPITWFGSIKMLIILILKKKFKKMLIILGLE